MAREHPFEPIAESVAVEAGRGRDHRRAQLAPESGVIAAVFEHQARQPEERLPQETPADAL